MRQYIYVLVLFFFVSLTPAFSQIVNTGILQIESSALVYFGDEYTNKNTANHHNNGDLYLKNNFINDGITTANSGTTFFILNNSTENFQSISGLNKNINFYNLKVDVESGKKGVLVADDFELVVKNSINLNNGNLRLVGEAQLLQTHTGTTGNSGSGKLLKDQQGTSNLYDYNYWCAPVSTGGKFSLTSLKDGTDSATNTFDPASIIFSGGYNGSASTPITISTAWVYNFLNSIDDYNGWKYIGSSGALNVAEGFTMKGTGAFTDTQNYVYVGTPNDGDYVHTIAPNMISLLGNPYPSALDANQFIIDNLGVLDASTGLLFWDHFGGNSHYSSNYQGGYASYTLSGGNAAVSYPGTFITENIEQKTPKRYIPIGQGFFVTANETGGNVVFNNSQRKFVTEANDANSLFLKQQSQNKNTDSPISRIRIGHEDAAGFHRYLMVAFIEGTTEGIDLGYEGKLSDEQANDMFWIIENDKFVIQAMPYNEDSQIALGIKGESLQTHTIMLDAVENYDGEVFLLDTQTGLTHDLKLSSFEVELNSGEFLDRFKVVFKNAVLSINNYNYSHLNAHYNKNSNNIVIQNPSFSEITKTEIYNTLGQLVSAIALNKNSAEIEIPFNKTKGVYILKIKTTKEEKTVKFIN